MRIWFASCLALYACNQAPTYVLLEVPDPADGGVTTRDGSVPRRDGGVRDAGMDAGPLPAHDRTLTTYRILGETPIENLVMNPQLDLHTTLMLFSFDGTHRRHQLTSTPSGLPALEVLGRNGAVVPIQPRPVALDVSIWLGRRGSAPSTGASITGLTRNGVTEMASLVLDAESREEHGEIVWRRWVGSISESFLGQVQLVIDNGGSDASLFATGPIVVPAQSGVRGPRYPTIALRPMDEGLREKLERVFARAKEEARRSLHMPDR